MNILNTRHAIRLFDSDRGTQANLQNVCISSQTYWQGYISVLKGKVKSSCLWDCQWGGKRRCGGSGWSGTSKQEDRVLVVALRSWRERKWDLCAENQFNLRQDKEGGPADRVEDFEMEVDWYQARVPGHPHKDNRHFKTLWLFALSCSVQKPQPDWH